MKKTAENPAKTTARATKTPKAASTRRKTAAKPKRAPKKSVLRLFQLHHQAPPLAQLDSGFEPLQAPQTSGTPTAVTVLRQLQADPSLRDASLWGVLPADFHARSGLNGEQLRATIEANPGYDLYFCNPNPEFEGLYHNPWLQAAAAYPDFAMLSREFFSAAGLGNEIVDAIAPAQLFANGQFLIASPALWNAYLDFIQNTLAEADAHLNKTARALLNTPVSDDNGQTAGTSFLSLILDRLLTLFLMMPRDTPWRACKLPLEAREQKLNVHLRLLREMKDLALAQNSYWEAACWANYRTLYLMQAHNRDWLQQRLNIITPPVLRFAYPVAQIHYPFVRTDQAVAVAAQAAER